MYKFIKNTVLILSMLMLVNVSVLSQDNPPVKKSKSGICHPKGGTYYSRTKHFISYKTMEACIKSGGRKPKR